MLGSTNYDFGITTTNKLVYKKGNLVDAFVNGDVVHMIHGCNCFNIMGSGIAQTIKSRLPEMNEADQETIKGDVYKFGSFSYHDYGNCFGFNVYCQYNYGNKGLYLDYDALEVSLKSVSNFLEERCGVDNPQVIGLPMIGCGLAGGDWNKVLPIIQKTLLKHTVYIYQL